MFVYNWVKDAVRDIWDWFGLLPQNSKILFLGLDNAGKTTLMHMLKEDRLGQMPPTYHPHSEELLIGSRRFKAFDMGGHETARRIWRDYYADVDAVVFLVDAADKTRLNEAAHELQGLFETEALKHVPFVILGNKIDIPYACSDDELRNYLQLPMPAYGGQQYTFRPGGGPIEVFMTSIKKKMGYVEGFKWLINVLNDKQNGKIEY